jgi:hypothetical membrane protein
MKDRSKLGMLQILVVAATFLHLASVIIFGWLEPQYSHTYQAVSELGALRAKYTLPMNLFGLFLPGILLAIAFYKFAQLTWLNVLNRCAMYLMSIFGLMFAALAAPMDLTSLPIVGVTLHFLMAYGSVLPFMAAASIVAFQWKNISENIAAGLGFVSLPVVFILFHALGSFGLASGFVQRGLLLTIFLWSCAVVFAFTSKSAKRH